MDNERTITYNITSRKPLTMDHNYAHCNTIVQFTGFEAQGEDTTFYLMLGSPLQLMIPLTDDMEVLVTRDYTKKSGKIIGQLLECKLAEESEDEYEFMRYSDTFDVIITPSLAAASMVEVTDPRLELIYTSMHEMYLEIVEHEFTAEQSAESAALSATNAASSEATALAASANASASEQSAVQSATNAATSETNAASSAQQAANDASRAGSFATRAHAEALVAEGYAVGTQGGKDVSSTSPYYENNAKYYAEEIATAIVETVDEWLDEHPEATTTVQDDSLTSIKLKNTSVPFYNVTDYGVVPNSGDIYSELYDLLANYVYDTGGVVYFPEGKYTLGFTIFIPENTTFIGDGEDTEIYFDETDTDFGVGLCNAGSNVTVKNLKLSQKSTGTFHTGSQPGCMAFGDIAKSQVKAGKYSHSYARANTYNLVAENLVFSGFYAIQTENSADCSVHNVIYRNLYCPDSCVSVMAGLGGINNVVIENVVCDMIRLYRNATEAQIKNATLENVVCQKFILSNALNSDDCKITVSKLYQTTKERKNDLYSNYSGNLQGMIVFNSCVFNSLITETNGIGLYTGIKEFHSCLFNMQTKFFTNLTPLTTGEDYVIAKDCIFNQANTDANGGVLFGFGKNNTYNDSNMGKWLWGEVFIYRDLTSGSGVGQATSSFPKCRLYVNGDKFVFKSYVTITNTNDLGTYNEGVLSLPIWDDYIPVSIWNSTDRAGTLRQTYAQIIDGKLQVAETGLTNSTAYNRALININLQLSRLFTASDLYTLYSTTF